MPRLREKPYTRKRASLETKTIFEDFGSRTGNQQSTAQEFASLELCSGAYTPHTCINMCSCAVPANICSPCDAGRCTEATSEVQDGGCDTTRIKDNVPCFPNGSTLRDSSDGSLRCEKGTGSFRRNVRTSQCGFSGDRCAVIKFPEKGDSVVLVHTKRLHGDVCLWPQDFKNISYLATCGAFPSSIWQVVPCVPIDTFRAQKRYGRSVHKQSSHASTSRANAANVCSDVGAVQCEQMCASETSDSEGEVDSGGEQDAKQKSSGIERSLTAHSFMKTLSKPCINQL
ncbi:uncharacterized protein [Dermacentor albipictus]|uniref:uncharacterized protein isoform X3 n=1 Tax=Dermacentor albipictus TaxID=60249 RepID=UPI0031FBEDED